MPGFRKGKAPTEILEKNFRPSIEREWKQVLQQSALMEALHLVKIYPFQNDSVKKVQITQFSPSEGAQITYEYEAAPQVPSVNLNEIAIPPVQKPVLTDAMFLNALDNILLQQAEWIEVQDRPVQEGDFVEIDIEALTEPAHNICAGARFHVAQGKIDPWLYSLLVGMQPGQTAEKLSETADEKKEDAHCDACETGSGEHAHHSHGPVNCRVMLHAVKQAKVPPLDDELAKKLGADNLEQLKERLTASLNSRIDEEYQQQQRLVVKEQLLESYPFELPRGMLAPAFNFNKKKLLHDLKASGKSEEQAAQDAQRIEAETYQKLQSQFRLFLLARKILETQKIDVTPNEVIEEIGRQHWMNRFGGGSFDLSRDPKEIEAEVRFHLQIIKAIDFLIQNVQK